MSDSNHEDKKQSSLQVKSGVEPSASVNPEQLRKLKASRRRLSLDEYVKGILGGDRTVLSRAITLIESSKAEHQELAQAIIERCLPKAGRSVRIGITGVPGVGKSTFIEALGNYLTGQGRKLAVLAIDPSSSRTGGSILGDKTRMETLANNPDAFIRPSPTAGSLGGVARKTRETIFLCEAAGFDTIFIETVGVGQSETAVHSMVDFFLLLMLAGAGDELQGIKRGIMEMADAIAINKADGENRNEARRAANEYKNALHLFPPPESGWTPQVTTCSALENRRIDKVWSIINDYLKHTRENGFFEEKRHRQARHWMYETIQRNLERDFYSHPDVKTSLDSIEAQVLKGQKSSFRAAQELLELYRGKKQREGKK